MKPENKGIESNLNAGSPFKGPKIPKNSRKANQKQIKQYERSFPDSNHRFNKLPSRKSIALTNGSCPNFQKKGHSKGSLSKSSSKFNLKEKTPKHEKNRGTVNVYYLQRELEELREENRRFKEVILNQSPQNQRYSHGKVHKSNEDWTKIQFLMIEFGKAFENFIRKRTN